VNERQGTASCTHDKRHGQQERKNGIGEKGKGLIVKAVERGVK
jgi:hypothetical protein